jgi:hypothetical protein
MWLAPSEVVKDASQRALGQPCHECLVAPEVLGAEAQNAEGKGEQDEAVEGQREKSITSHA